MLDDWGGKWLSCICKLKVDSVPQGNNGAGLGWLLELRFCDILF